MWLLHILAFIFFMPALFLTIPLHILIKKADNKQAAQETQSLPMNAQQDYDNELARIANEQHSPARQYQKRASIMDYVWSVAFVVFFIWLASVYIKGV